MISEIKKLFLSNPKYIETLLERYQFFNIRLYNNEIRFGRAEESNKTSLRIKLLENQALYVNDFAQGQSFDIFDFIVNQRDVTLKDVFITSKKILGLKHNFTFAIKKSIFGGFYKNINNKNSPLGTALPAYEDKILEDYKLVYNYRFYKDHINFLTQKKFGIRYDIMSDKIIIPIYDELGNLVGIKGRANFDITENKYIYLIPCKISQVLYGYYQNYGYLTNGEVYICESEKGVMQAYNYGFKNVVALCGNTIHSKQCELIINLNPNKIVFLLDKGLDFNIIESNICKIQKYTRLLGIQIGYWDEKATDNIPLKASPMDLGGIIYSDIITSKIKFI